MIVGLFGQIKKKYFFWHLAGVKTAKIKSHIFNFPSRLDKNYYKKARW
jgi:hypothetical protein